jgi:hypothetical protein
MLAEGPWHHEPVAQRAHPQRRGVGTPRALATVMQDAEDGHPSAPGDPQHERVDQARGGPDQAAGAR